MRILILTNIPSPYRVDFFNELGKTYELTVVFEKRNSDERDDSWKNFVIENFKAVFLKGFKIRTDSSFCPGIMRYISKRKFDHIIVTNFSDLTGILAISYMKIKGISYGVESDGGFAGTGNGIKEKLKKWLLSSAKYYFSTALEHDKYYMKYGARKNEIIRYPFSSLHNNDILKAPLNDEEKSIIRKKLNIKENKVILSVGQFIYRKGYDVLFDALVQIDSAIGCYIVGGEPTEEYLQLVKKYKLKNIHFIGFKNKEELEEYYKAADIFVHPTREDIWGLVINEAMAKGLPIVTTDKCIAGLELIGNRSIGTIVPINDSCRLAEAIQMELSTTSYEKSMLILQRIRNYTIETMAEAHERLRNN